MLRRTLLIIALIAAGTAVYGHAASFIITNEIISSALVISAADVPTTQVGGPDPLQSAPPAATDLAAVCPEDEASTTSVEAPYRDFTQQPGAPGDDPCGEDSSADTDSGAPAVQDDTSTTTVTTDRPTLDTSPLDPATEAAETATGTTGEEPADTVAEDPGDTASDDPGDTPTEEASGTTSTDPATETTDPASQ